ncbi:hypothetical protein LF836_30210, partial [Pseudomonas aeruginosa]|uniref:hypothetical protein n=1 Tax=Pseudomonas aeruginosa TaxID=287 RepID=UPI001CF48A6A
REVSALTDARKTLAYDFFRILRAPLKQLNWASEGVGATAAALVDLSTVAGNKISNPPWVKFQSAGWVNFPSAPTPPKTICTEINTF